MYDPNAQNIKPVFCQRSCLVKTDYVQLPTNIDPNQGQKVA